MIATILLYLYACCLALQVCATFPIKRKGLFFQPLNMTAPVTHLDQQNEAEVMLCGFKEILAEDFQNGHKEDSLFSETSLAHTCLKE